MKVFLSFLLLLGLFSCKQKQPVPLFQLVENTGINFENKVKDGQVENSFFFRNFYNGGGVALGDINNDSLPDIMLTSNMGDNKLYLNKGNFEFEDITSKSGLFQDSMWSTGIVMVDINGDGWLDLYVCNSGHMQGGKRKNQLFINQHLTAAAHAGGPSLVTFKEEAAAYGLDISGYCTQSSFFDYDLDGDLDCFIINNSPVPINTLGYKNRRDLADKDWSVAGFLKGGGDHLYKNDNGHFSEVTKQAGIHGTLMSFGLGVSVSDINNDGFPDIYVANDSYERDYLYINQKNGTFIDDLENCVGQNSFSSMGADISDVNNDGYPDIFTTDMLPGQDFRLKTLGAFDNIDLHRQRIKTGLYYQYMKNCLMVNNKNGRFLETANFSGVNATDWSWGALFFDADNDGLNDIYVCNGVNRDVTNLDFMDFFANDLMQGMVMSGHKEGIDSVLMHIPVNAVPNCAFKNNGNLHFTDAAKEWGLATPSFSNGAAYADLDNDGDLDLVVNNENQKAFVYRNNVSKIDSNNYLAIMLRANAPNTFAIGSKINIYIGKQIISREVIPSRGFQSSMDYKQVIGLGKNTKVDSMIIIWPDHTFTKYENPRLNKLYNFEKVPNQKLYNYTKDKVENQIFTPDNQVLEKHQEDDYTDFYYERNLPEMLSTEGPHIAKGDVNGDGMEDIYIGGAKDQKGQLYLQTTDGRFVLKEQSLFKQYQDLEDVAVLFFDADKDGDLDLFIGAGGNNVQRGRREIQHRLYKNDGRGNFLIDVSAFQENNMNISVAVAYDYDNDGDEDLFVGSRSVPFLYGQTPQSYLYQNDGKGHFTDVATNQISTMGMVTDAVWVDIAGDAKKELVVTGEWMSTKVFSNNNNTWQELKNTGLEHLFGWWQTIATADINNDGKQDLIIGNIGENFYLKPNAENPVKLWVNDFDNNGTMDQFLTRTVDKRDVPVFLKREITDQFPGLKKDNLKHSDYAKKSIQELFKEETLIKAQKLQFNFCSSIIALNDGKGHFNVKPLPLEVQLSSLNAICTTDINGDGKTDILAGGNMFSFPPQFGRLDASYGHVLINKGLGEFSYVENKKTGLNIKGQIKDIKEVKTKKGRKFIITQNDESSLVYNLIK